MLDDLDQLVARSVQVDCVAGELGKRRNALQSVVVGAVEASVDDALYPRENRSIVPGWLPPLLAAVLVILLLNLAHFEQSRRARRRSWDVRLLSELWAWDGRLPEELARETCSATGSISRTGTRSEKRPTSR